MVGVRLENYNDNKSQGQDNSGPSADLRSSLGPTCPTV